MRIAMIGQKGIPAAQGGVERHVEELAAQLVAAGHEVTVFVRPTYVGETPATYRGVRLLRIPTIGTKHLDAITHALLCTLYCCMVRFDVVHYHGIGPSLLTPLARMARLRVVCTVHAQDWRQRKWGPFAKVMLRLGEWFAFRLAHAVIVVSPVMHRMQGPRVEYIPNGVALSEHPDKSVLCELGVAPDEFGLFVGRLIPDKGLEDLAGAWRAAGILAPLVVVGESSFTDAYSARIRSEFGDVCRFAGGVYGDRLVALYETCRLFILPSYVEGLPIVLLEALSSGARVLASDLDVNAEVLGDSRRLFRTGDVADLQRALMRAWVVDSPAGPRDYSWRKHYGSQYEWSSIARRTIEVYEAVRRF